MTPGNNQINPECETFYNWPGLLKKKKINAMKIKGWVKRNLGQKEHTV